MSLSLKSYTYSEADDSIGPAHHSVRQRGGAKSSRPAGNSNSNGNNNSSGSDKSSQGSMSSLSDAGDYRNRVISDKTSRKISPNRSSRSSPAASDLTLSPGARDRALTTPRSPGVLSDSSDSARSTGSFRPKVNINIASLAAGLSGRFSSKSNKSDFSDISDGDTESYKDSLKTEHMSLTGLMSMTAGPRASSTFKGSSGKTNTNSAMPSASSSQRTFNKPLKMTLKSTSIVEVDDEEAGGDEFENNIERRRGASREGIRPALSTYDDRPKGGFEVVSQKSSGHGVEADAFKGLSSYHLAYLMGVNAGAKAAEEGAIGGQSTDDSAWEGGAGGKGKGGFSGAAGGGGGGRPNPRFPQSPVGDDVYALGFAHGRSHGGPAAMQAYADLEANEEGELTLDERIQRLRDANATTFSDVETIWDSPSRFEQLLLDYCICPGITDRICCSSGFLCLARDTVDAILVVLCFFGSIVAMIVVMATFHVL